MESNWTERFVGDAAGQSEIVLPAEVMSAQRFEAGAVEFVEVSLGDDAQRIVVMRADCLPQLKADWIAIQPEVVQVDPTWGWEPVGMPGIFVGSGEPSRLRVPADCPETMCSISSTDADEVRVANFSGAPLRLLAQRRHR